MDTAEAEINASGSGVRTADIADANMNPDFVHWAEGAAPGRRDTEDWMEEGPQTAQSAILATVVDMDALAEMGAKQKEFNAM
eukprot:3378213-Pyramimonas_sp.AAC.1